MAALMAPMLFGEGGGEGDGEGEGECSVFAELPPELIEIILSHVWQFHDQLACRLVCKWWQKRIGTPVKRGIGGRVVRQYSLTDTAWATFSGQNRVMRMLDFKPLGATHLREYYPDSDRIQREVVFCPPNRAIETTHERNGHRQVVTSWHFRTHISQTVTKHVGIVCSIL